MTRFAVFATIALGAASFAFGYASARLMFLGLIAIILGAVWMYGQWRGSQRFSRVGLGVAVSAGAIGVVLGVNSGWLFAGVSFSLFAWDLMEFHNRMKFTSDEDDVPALERKHLLRLGILAAAEIILFVMTVFIHLRLGLWWLIFLAFVTALGLTQLIWRFHAR